MEGFSEIYLIIIAGLSIIFGILFAKFIFWLKNQMKKSPYKNTENLTGNKDDLEKKISHINNHPKQIQQLEKLDSIVGQDTSTKTNDILEDEIKLYQFEKDLVTRAIENILVASRNNSIDNLERDRLIIKYKQQLGSLNQNMERIQSQIDITKLMNFRDDLMNILENKMSQIDEKITEINFKYNNFVDRDLPNKNNSIKLTDNKSNNYQKQTTFKDKINKIFNRNPESKFTKKLLDIKTDKKREIVDYKSDHPSKEGDIEEEEKVQKLSKKVLVALENLDKTKPLEDSINDKMKSINRYDDKEHILKEKPKTKIDIKKVGIPIISIFKRDTNDKKKAEQDIQQKESKYLEPKGEDNDTDKSIGRFPLASLFSRQENTDKTKQENERKVKNIIIRDEEKEKEQEQEQEQNRNSLGNIFKNIRY